MSNVLNEEKKQQVIALGRLGWTLRRIEQATGVRRETAGAYLKAAGVAVRPAGGWGRRSAKPANGVITDSADSKPANEAGVTTDFIRPFSETPPLQLPGPHPPASASELHETAFRRLGGSCRVLILDNLKEGVLKPDIYDPILNPLFKDVLAHYDVVAMPCRVGDPDRKGKVESGVGHAQKTPLKGMRFESLEEAQAYLDQWEARWADTRIHGTTKRQVATMFAEEKPFLIPLPLEPFRYYQYGERTVHLDGCVEVDAAYYSVPPGWIGKLVNVQWDSLHVRILDPRIHQLLREHVRQERGRHRIRPEDNPKKMPFTTAQLLTRANRAGTHIGPFCKAIHDHKGEPGVRGILGVL